MYSINVHMCYFTRIALTVVLLWCFAGFSQDFGGSDAIVTVMVMFKYQKRDLQFDAVTQSHSGDPLLCPVRAAAAVVQQLHWMGDRKETGLETGLE